MARKACRKDPSLTGLHKLPNEILFEIAFLLRIPDLRRLGEVNRRLHYFIEDYLMRYLYNARIFSLPNEVILSIVQHLRYPKDWSSLARASRRFYPLVMDYIFRKNVQYAGSSLLNYSAKRDLNRVARMILHFRGDVNTQWGYSGSIPYMDKQQTPLANAAANGSGRMVKMLLENGASQFIDGIRVPLLRAILKRHENVALILSQEVDSSEVLLEITRSTRSTALQMACTAGLVNLVQYYLEHGSRGGECPNVHILHDRSIALCRTIQKDATKDDFVKRELHEDVYQIVLMLLKHGANPDTRVETRCSPPVTARAIASGHPDPRVRNLLVKARPGTESKGSSLMIGRPWLSPEDEAVTFQESQSEASPSEESCYARLWDFLGTSNAATPMSMDEDEIDHSEINDEGFTLSASDLADVAELRTQKVIKNSEAIEPPTLSSYPQLSVTKTDAQHATKTFWAKLPVQTFPDVKQSIQTPSMSGKGRIPREAKQPKQQAEMEPFPRLGQLASNSNDTGKDLWARFSTDKVSQSTSVTQRASLGEESDVQPPAHKQLKKKKWKPLLIGG